jgi:hypothetical protein
MRWREWRTAVYRILDFFRLYLVAEGSLVEPVENRHFLLEPLCFLGQIHMPRCWLLAVSIG